ncbi:hypothetical protein PROFUN_08768 [Planoprotostelium fungivorum]|uniref:Uncharacterized protein n=1 Tax=Planoprotostelium fungivorum TaxID=1890364 RepID=A0A2P6MVQ5_9EUKA|nr:hypothetical protein PROFUN_08768 [Planoprotostelium fungivorum]
MEESITDSHQHALGECIFTRELNDQLWATLKQFWDKSKIRTENILPWFSTSDYDQYEWNLPEEMGNKGLIPCNLRQKIIQTSQFILLNNKGSTPYPQWTQGPHTKLAPIYLYTDVQKDYHTPS